MSERAGVSGWLRRDGGRRGAGGIHRQPCPSCHPTHQVRCPFCGWLVGWLVGVLTVKGAPSVECGVQGRQSGRLTQCEVVISRDDVCESEQKGGRMSWSAIQQGD